MNNLSQEIKVYSIESLADGPASHEMFRRLLIACLSAIGGHTEDVEASFAYVGMPSEWRGAIWSAITEIENIQRRDNGNPDHARALFEVCYANLHAFKVGLQWHAIVEAGTLRTLRALKAKLISEIANEFRRNTDQTNSRRFVLYAPSGNRSRKHLTFEEIADVCFEPYTRSLRDICLLDVNADLKLGDMTVIRMK